MKRLIGLAIAAVFIIVFDQWSKEFVESRFYLGESVKVIDGLFNFTFVKNRGAAFGFGGDSSEIFRLVLFKILPVFACFYLLFLTWESYKKNLFLSIGWMLVLSGAIGNLIDRIGKDYVVDFFDFYIKEHHFAVFNIADSAISVGGAILIIDYIIQQKKEKQKKVLNQA